MSVLAVVTVFLWKACNNLLPTKENLFKKRLLKTLCMICSVEVENTCYILWRCHVQGNSNSKIQKYSTGGEDFQQITCELLEKLENEEFELIATIARRIWLHRSKWFSEEISTILPNLGEVQRKQWMDFVNLNKR
jgi:hypothetical protein